VLATYGLYCGLRDSGYLNRWIDTIKAYQSKVNQRVVNHLHQSFILEQKENIPNRNALYVCSPHGLVGYSWFFHFSFCLSDWPSSSPRPLLAAHSILFHIPIAKEILEANRCIEASERSILNALQKGHSVALIVGGVEEMFHAGDSTVKLVLKKRKGYVRLAKQAGVPLVPVYTHGETSLLGSESSWLWKQFSGWMYRWTHLQFPLPSWQHVKEFARIVRGPLETPVKTFVLAPIETQEKEEESLRKDYIQHVQAFLRQKKFTTEIVA
jgi:1-acyl-sn-glycerol-3-phosphate acyltransferase